VAKAFASQADLEEKQISFEKLAEGVYCITAEGDPNTGIIIGDDGVMVIDARATPVMAQEAIDLIRTVTDLPVKYVFLTHYHAVRVMGASAYNAEHIISSRKTLDLIKERGRQDFKSEVGRFPRLFQAVETVPGLTWPTMTFETEMTIWMGRREVRMVHLGAGHTKGDAVVWLPKEKIMFSGDLVEMDATPYCGDAYLKQWPKTLDKLSEFKPRKLVPGRGPALKTQRQVEKGIDGTRSFVKSLMKSVKAGVKKRRSLKQVYAATYDSLQPDFGDWVIFDHCLPFNVTRCYDEVKGIEDPQIWTAKRDKDMWRSLESS